MLKCIPVLLVMVSESAMLAAQATKPPHHWAPLVRRADVGVELDTASLVARDHQRRVWLRWTFPTGMPDYADVQLEQREVDCTGPTTRVLATQDASVFDGRPSWGPLVRRDSGTVWVQPGAGSLVAQVVKALCG